MNRLVKYLSVILKWRKVLFLNVLSLMVLGALVSLVLPHKYKSVARVLPPAEDDVFGMASALGSGLGSSRLSRLVGGGIFGATTPSDLMVGIMRSRRVMQSVVVGCSVRQYYRVRRNSMESALRVLDKLTKMSVNDDGIVEIAVQARTPALAAKIANYYVAELDSFLRTSNISRGRSTRMFIERRLRDVERDLRLAEDSLQSFQSAMRTASVDVETKAAIEAYAKMSADLSAREAELRVQRSVSGDRNPILGRLSSEVDAIRAELRVMDSGGREDGFGVGFAVPFSSLPAIAQEYLRRLRAYRTQEEAFALLYEQYEYARIMEARDAPALSVLDMAVPPERRSFPRRALIVVVVGAFGLIVGFVVVLVVEYFERLKVLSPREHDHWRVLASEVAAAFRFLAGGRRRG